MNLQEYPGINDARKSEILGWSDAEILIEIEKGPRGRLPACIPFMKAVLAERESIAAAKRNLKEDELNAAMLEEARSANAASKVANRYALIALIISLAAMAISVLK